MLLGNMTRQQFYEVADVVVQVSYSDMSGQNKLSYVMEYLFDKVFDDATADWLAMTVAQLVFSVLRRKGEV